MSLFGDLPAPSKRTADGDVTEERKAAKAARLSGPGAAAAAVAPTEPSAADLEDLEEEEEAGPPPGGVADVHGIAGGMQQEEEEASDMPPPPPPPAAPTSAPMSAPASASGDDQVAAALRKIASHIGSAKKFTKASQLLRELLSQGAVRAAHGPLLFSALKAAMRDPGQAADPLLAREYSKLFTAASKMAEVFTAREKNQLDVYGTWAVLRSQLNTDDSFQFNKVVARLKQMAEELPAAEEGDEEVVARLAAAAGRPDPVLAHYDTLQQQRQQEADAPAAPAAAAAAAAGQAGAAAAAAGQAGDADIEADPFGLDALLEQQEAEAEAQRRAQEAQRERQRREQPPKSATWSGAEVVCQRRAALLDCLDAAKACYRHLWARTSVDLLIEHCHKHKQRFAPSQAERIDALMAFVRDQRRIRKLGPSAKEVNRDTTTFERARAEWGRAAVSARGKVGGGGDHQSETWLG